MLREPRLALAPVGERALKDVPERWTVIRLDDVRQFVNHHVFDDVNGEHDRPPVEIDLRWAA